MAFFADNSKLMKFETVLNPVSKTDTADTVLNIQPVNPETFPTTSQVGSQPQTKPTTTGRRYLVSDWSGSRERFPLGGGGGKTAGQKIAGGASIGGAVGSAVPVFGTALGSGIGAAIGGLSSLFGGEKHKRLIQHLEEFYVELIAQSFGNDAFTIGLGASDGNGRNAANISGQFPKQEMEQFLIKSGQQFLTSIQDLSFLNSKDRAAIQKVAGSLRFTDRLPKHGEMAVYLSFKPESVIYQKTETGITQTGQPKPQSKAAEQNKKLTGGIAVGLLSLFLFR